VAAGLVAGKDHQAGAGAHRAVEVLTISGSKTTGIGRMTATNGDKTTKARGMTNGVMTDGSKMTREKVTIDGSRRRNLSRTTGGNKTTEISQRTEDGTKTNGSRMRNRNKMIDGVDKMTMEGDQMIVEGDPMTVEGDQMTVEGDQMIVEGDQMTGCDQMTKARAKLRVTVKDVQGRLAGIMEILMRSTKCGRSPSHMVTYQAGFG